MGQSNFNLRQSIDNYIGLIRKQGSITGQDADELTAHLQDATDELQKYGLAEEEAFIIACKRLGHQELLTEEYSKVNPSLNTNKTWAYLLTGFNFIYSISSIILLCIVLCYRFIYLNFHDSPISAFIISCFNLLFIVFVVYVVRNKNTISRYLESQVNINPLRIVVFSFLPLLLLFSIKALLKSPDVYSYLGYPVYKSGSHIAAFSFYLATLSIIAGVISLVFSINKIEKLTLKVLFEKPSIVFLIIFGMLAEILAASTRVLNNVIGVSAIVFGAIYFGSSFLVTCYNKQGPINRYLTISFLSGLIIETVVGIDADMDRGNTFLTIYYVSAMLLCIIGGRWAGLKTGNSIVEAETSIN